MNNQRYIKDIEGVVRTTQRIFKDAARGLIHQVYGLCPDIRSEQTDTEVLLKQHAIPNLLQDFSWLHKRDLVCVFIFQFHCSSHIDIA